MSLFSPFSLGTTTLRNRIVMSPMCQYKSHGDGRMNDWHTVHYLSRAIGGTGLILTEMTNVEPRGRITLGCLGLWNEGQADAFARLADQVHGYGAAIGIQLAHAGRKCLIAGNDTVGPSSVPFDGGADRPPPRPLLVGEIESLIEAFGRSAALAARAGFDVIELHGAHGYLIHQFMSPSSNKREDEYGDKSKFAIDVVQEVRRNIPPNLPLMFRVSAVETNPDGYSIADVFAICDRLCTAGVDAFDVTTSGNGPIRPLDYPGYQLHYAGSFKQRYGLPTSAVGRLESPAIAEYAIQSGAADLTMIGRGLLRNPYWARDAADHLRAELRLPGEYERGIK